MKRTKKLWPFRKAFTLIELLVVIAIIAILVAGERGSQTRPV